MSSIQKSVTFAHRYGNLGRANIFAKKNNVYLSKISLLSPIKISPDMVFEYARSCERNTRAVSYVFDAIDTLSSRFRVRVDSFDLPTTLIKNHKILHLHKIVSK